ncbi:hypothetical protein AOLI_G00142180 [Acnodon oligacanthus]
MVRVCPVGYWPTPPNPNTQTTTGNISAKAPKMKLHPHHEASMSRASVAAQLVWKDRVTQTLSPPPSAQGGRRKGLTGLDVRHSILN